MTSNTEGKYRTREEWASWLKAIIELWPDRNLLADADAILAAIAEERRRCAGICNTEWLNCGKDVQWGAAQQAAISVVQKAIEFPNTKSR